MIHPFTFLKGKLLPLEFQYYENIANSMYDINTSSAPVNISKFKVHALGVRRLLTFAPNAALIRVNMVMFKTKPFHVLALKSGMGYTN